MSDNNLSINPSEIDSLETDFFPEIVIENTNEMQNSNYISSEEMETSDTSDDNTDVFTKIQEEKDDKMTEPVIQIVINVEEKAFEEKEVETKEVETKEVETKEVEEKDVEMKDVEMKDVEIETKEVEEKEVETKEVEVQTNKKNKWSFSCDYMKFIFGK